MEPQTIVFVGPSLQKEDVEVYPEFRFLPPVARGDILRALKSRPKKIGVIDGYFGDRPSVLHKEILEAIASGCHVLGAASMGALRASELDRFGMIGIGSIYKEYSTGARISDADVAISHGPEETGYAELSLPQVDVDATIDALVSRRRITEFEAQKILCASRAIYYKERSWIAIAEAVFEMDDQSKSFAKLLSKTRIQAKRLDAIALLCSLKAKGKKTTHSVTFHPPITPVYRKLRNSVFS